MIKQIDVTVSGWESKDKLSGIYAMGISTTYLSNLFMIPGPA